MFALSGCNFDATQQGERGNLEFSYTAADGRTEFDRPLAVGSELTMHIEPVDNRGLDQIDEVTVTPGDVLGVEFTDSSDSFRLHALSGGEARVRVEVRDGNTTYVDETPLRVDHVDSVQMGHRCTEAAGAAYLWDTEIDVDWNRRNAAGETLIGSAENTEGDAPRCHADIQPVSYQTAPQCDSTGLHFPPIDELVSLDLFAEEGLETGGVQDMGIHVIDPVNMQFDPPEDYVEVGRTEQVQLLPVWDPVEYEGWWPVCTNMELEVEIINPATCIGPADRDEFTVDPDDQNQVKLEGKLSGICHLDVSLARFPDAGTWPIEVEVVR